MVQGDVDVILGLQIFSASVGFPEIRGDLDRRAFGLELGFYLLDGLGEYALVVDAQEKVGAVEQRVFVVRGTVLAQDAADDLLYLNRRTHAFVDISEIARRVVPSFL